VLPLTMPGARLLMVSGAIPSTIMPQISSWLQVEVMLMPAEKVRGKL
jgi:hypothetical protein